MTTRRQVEADAADERRVRKMFGRDEVAMKVREAYDQVPKLVEHIERLEKEIALKNNVIKTQQQELFALRSANAELLGACAAMREALEQSKAALGDRLLAKGPLVKEYANHVFGSINAALSTDAGKALLERLARAEEALTKENNFCARQYAEAQTRSARLLSACQSLHRHWKSERDEAMQWRQRCESDMDGDIAEQLAERDALEAEVAALKERARKLEADAADERRVRKMFGRDIAAIMEAFGTPCKVEQADLARHVRRLLAACQSLHRRWKSERDEVEALGADAQQIVRSCAAMREALLDVSELLARVKP